MIPPSIYLPYLSTDAHARTQVGRYTHLSLCVSTNQSRARKISGQTILIGKRSQKKFTSKSHNENYAQKSLRKLWCRTKITELSLRLDLKACVTNKNLTHHHIRQWHLDFCKHDFCVIGPP